MVEEVGVKATVADNLPLSLGDELRLALFEVGLWAELLAEGYHQRFECAWIFFWRGDGGRCNGCIYQHVALTFNNGTAYC